MIAAARRGHPGEYMGNRDTNGETGRRETGATPPRSGFWCVWRLRRGEGGARARPLVSPHNLPHKWDLFRTGTKGMSRMSQKQPWLSDS